MSTWPDPNDVPTRVGGGGPTSGVAAGGALTGWAGAERGGADVRRSGPSAKGAEGAADAGEIEARERREDPFSSPISPLELLMSERTALRPGARLDRYELLSPVASGGMGRVWVARMEGKHGFERLVALKTILPHRSEEKRLKQMFLDEARIAADIEHVNVARILDLGEQDGVLYLVMEWVDGDSLARLQSTVERQGERLAQGVALRAIADACSGLHAAHELRDREGVELRVVHRDVSPQNILLSVDGFAKIIDFGIAKARHRMSSDTTDGVLRGKLLYMSAEQALGREIDRRADVYSLGAVLYSLLAGSPPYKGPNEAATFGFVTSGLPPPPLPRHVPSPVAQVVRKALARLEERYATAAELKLAIEAAMVESHLTTSQEDVAAYVNQHLGDRIAARKVFIQHAIEACRVKANGGADTAAPIVADLPSRGTSPALLRPRDRAVRWAALALALLVPMLTFLLLGRSRAPAPPTAAHEELAALTSKAEPLPAAPPVAAPVAASEAPAPAPAPKVARPADPPKRTPSVRPQRAASGDCAPPFILDSNGIRHYKRACFH